MKRIDDQALRRVVGMEILKAAHQEVAGEIDALGADSGAAGDLDVDERHRDRDALLPIHHFVQAAVARILELLAIARESELAEQVPIDRVDARGERRIVSRVLRDEMKRRIAHLFETIEIRRRIQARVLDSRDQERRRGQVRPRAIGGIGDLFRQRLRHDSLNRHKARPARRG